MGPLWEEEKMKPEIDKYRDPDEFFEKARKLRESKHGEHAQRIASDIMGDVERDIISNPNLKAVTIFVGFNWSELAVEMAVKIIQEKGFAVRYKKQRWYQAGYWEVRVSGWREKGELTTPHDGPYRK